MKNHLLIGLGGTGGAILKSFKKRLWREFPDGTHGNNGDHACAFLYVDSDDKLVAKPTDPSWHVVGVPETACFTNNEFLNISTGASIGTIIGNAQILPALRPIITRAEALRETIGDIDEAAGQNRRAGRIMFALKAKDFVTSLNNACNSLSRTTHDAEFHIMIFAGLCGGTGSGTIIDAACLCKKNYPNARIEVYAQYPEEHPSEDRKRDRYLPNAYAALKELNALNCGAWIPYDVTSNNGQRYQFSQAGNSKLFGLVLYSECNTSNIRFQVDNLPDIVANHVYHKVFTHEIPNTTTAYFKVLSTENVAAPQTIERNQYNGSPARTAAVASFGIQRIVYPEKKFKARAAYELTKDAIYKLTFNNYDQANNSYANERRTDTVFTIVRDNLVNWKLTKEHLLLDKKVVQFGNNKHKEWKDIWDSNNPALDFAAAKANDTMTHNPIKGLENYLTKIFQHKFRDECGCEKWYETQIKNVHDYALCIADGVEKALFDNWKAGLDGYALSDLPGIATDLLGHVRNLLETCPVEQNQLKTEIEEKQSTIVAAIDKYSGKWPGFRESVFTKAVDPLYELYRKKTELQATFFEQALLKNLVNKFTKLKSDISAFVVAMSKALITIEGNITKCAGVVRTQDLYEIDNANVSKFVEFHRHTKTDVMDIADVFLASFARENDRSFGSIAEKMSSESDVCEAIETIVATKIESLHANDSNNGTITSPFLGTNVVAQLQNQAAASGDPNFLRTFIENRVRECSVMLRIDETQFNYNIAQVGQAPIVPFNTNVYHLECWLVSYPGANLAQRQQAFAQKMCQAFNGAISPNVEKVFDAAYEVTNEIAIAVACNMLPIRCISNWDWTRNELKEEYDALIQQNPANQMSLHLEDGLTLPSILLEVQPVRNEDFRMYLFVAAVEKIIESGMDDNNNEGWILHGEPDALNHTTKTLIGRTFTDIVSNITDDDRNALVNRVRRYMPSINRLEGNVKREKKASIQECGRVNLAELSGSNPVYKEFYSAMEKAIQLYD